MIIAFIILALLIVIFAPQIWTKYVFRRYSSELEELPGTGGQLAEHLVDKFKLNGVSVEQIENNEDISSIMAHNSLYRHVKLVRKSPQWVV